MTEEECRHKIINEESYLEEFYGRWTVITVKQCENCGEVLKEKKSELPKKGRS